MDESRLRPPALDRLRGDEPFSFGPTVADFWAWALGDLRMNTIRGYLVEFLVAKAVDAPAPTRVEWAPFDVEAGDGTRIEVKTTAYLQSWSQAKQTTPQWTFKSVATSSMWDEMLVREVPVDPRDRVDVWVFALQTCTEPAEYQPLDAAQWEFRVVAHRALLATGQLSARISTFDRLGIAPVGFDQLGRAVKDAREQNELLRPTAS